MNETSYEPGDPAWEITKALAHCASADGELLRARLRIAGVLNTPGELRPNPALASGSSAWAAIRAIIGCPAPAARNFCDCLALKTRPSATTRPSSSSAGIRTR
jgi:hypothetical protein